MASRPEECALREQQGLLKEIHSRDPQENPHLPVPKSVPFVSRGPSELFAVEPEIYCRMNTKEFQKELMPTAGISVCVLHLLAVEPEITPHVWLR